jgi:hypothetical protein
MKEGCVTFSSQALDGGCDGIRMDFDLFDQELLQGIFGDDFPVG